MELELAVVVHTCNPSTWEAEEGVLGQSGTHWEFKGNMKDCLKKPNKTKKKKKKSRLDNT